MNARAMDQGTFTLAAWTVLLRRDMNATGADLRDAIRNASDEDAAALVAYCAHPANGGYSAIAMEAAALVFLCSGQVESGRGPRILAERLRRRAEEHWTWKDCPECGARWTNYTLDPCDCPECAR